MRKIAILVSIIVLALYSCSDSKTKKPVSDEVKTEVKIKKVKTLAERKEEGKEVRKELNNYLKQIPENLVFKEAVVNAMGIKKSVFHAENVDEEARNTIEKWLDEQLKDMVAAKWEKTQLQDDDVISGMTYNSYSLKKAQDGDSSQSDMLNLTSVYSPDNMTYTIFVKPYAI